jgi:SPX domain protein involved in polyphosphate accumulation
VIKRFNRYELKYVLPVQKSRRIAEDLRAFTRPDEHGGEEGYRVVSLYYDSPALDFFWAKIEGIKFRRKVRIRIYPEDAGTTGERSPGGNREVLSVPRSANRGIADAGDPRGHVFFSDLPPRPEIGADHQQRPLTGMDAVERAMVEIKQRINRTVQKRRLQLPLEEAELLCEGSVDMERMDPLDRQVASEVQYLVNAMHLRPTCIIAYRRRAFVGSLYEPGLRITFDTDLRCRVHELKVNAGAENHLFLPPEWCIMEVKANNAVPDWVTSLLAVHNCQLRRVSKYCTGLALAAGIRVEPFAVSPLPEEK